MKITFSALNEKDGVIPGMALKDRIKEAMEGAGLKPLQLAKATKKSSGAVTQWTTGETKTLKAETAEAIEKATGYSARWIVTGHGPKLASSVQANDPSTQTELGRNLSPEAYSLGVLFDMIPKSDMLKWSEVYHEIGTLLISAAKRLQTPIKTPAPGQENTGESRQP